MRVAGVLCGPCAISESRASAPSETERLNEKLESLGINVPARGRFTWSESCAMVGGSGARAARDFLDRVCSVSRWEPVRGLILEGPTGVGKSLLAVAIVRELLVRGTLKLSEIRYDSSRGVWGRIKQGYGEGNADSEIEARIRARLWVLDDFGAEHPTEDTAINLTDILTARELRPTVLTVNLPRDLQGARWDPIVWDRIKSRLGERNFEVVTITGPDRRMVA